MCSKYDYTVRPCFKREELMQFQFFGILAFSDNIDKCNCSSLLKTQCEL